MFIFHYLSKILKILAYILHPHHFKINKCIKIIIFQNTESLLALTGKKHTIYFYKQNFYATKIN